MPLAAEEITELLKELFSYEKEHNGVLYSFTPTVTPPQHDPYFKINLGEGKISAAKLIIGALQGSFKNHRIDMPTAEVPQFKQLNGTLWIHEGIVSLPEFKNAMQNDDFKSILKLALSPPAKDKNCISTQDQHLR